jgi:16S rRNA G966 N2-methylase RsmD
MGLEALSRGAEHCLFVDQDRTAVRRLEQNLAALNIGPEAARVVQGSAFLPGWLTGLADGSVTLALLDPPYALTADLDPLLRLIEQLAPKLEPGGVAVFRTPEDVTAPDLPGYDGLARVTYGGMALHFFQTSLDEAAA